MAATLTMSGGVQEDPFYPLQKATLSAGFALEDSGLFGLDCKISETDKSVHNDYTQVNQSFLTRCGLFFFLVFFYGRGSSVVIPGCFCAGLHIDPGLGL